ncbi:MAG TPA: hypothetical protein VGD65_14665 [Chryseosolibacter sp.]
MKYTEEKLTELQKELKTVVKDVAAGKLNKQAAADKIVHLREQIDMIIDHLKADANK